MATATITVTDEEKEGQIGINVEFDPECKDGEETPAQVVALLMVKMASELEDIPGQEV